MAQQMTSTRSDRFVSAGVSELQQANRALISSCKDVQLMSLEDTVESIVPFVPNVKSDADKAKIHCRKNTPLTINESAAIYLYTMSTSFYPKLNEALRSENLHTLRPWFAFLKLFITAISKLPSRQMKVWRGVADNIGADFVDNDLHIWWSVNSCSSYLTVAGFFTTKTGTLFSIDTIHGKDISAYSANQEEEEIILMPGTCLRVKGTWSESNSLSIVHLEEW
jgi:hypothetical protein